MNEFETARTTFASAASSLPKDYLGGNAERLLLIAEELRKSFGVELKVFRLVSDLDTGDAAAVQAMATHFKWYVKDRIFNNERTHCHNIDRIHSVMVKPYMSGSPTDAQRIDAFNALVAPLTIADNDILDSLEPLAVDARDTVAKIESALGERDPARAKELKRAFVLRSEERIATARKELGNLSRLAGQLIDIASGLTPAR